MIHNLDQGSEAWDMIRRGKLTASEAGDWLVSEPKLQLTKEEISERLTEAGIPHKKSAKVGDLAALLPDGIVRANMGFLKKEQEARYGTMCRILCKELSTTWTEEWTGNKFTDFGHAFEDEACTAFELETGYETKKVGFVTLDGFDYFGCSPDRYVHDGIEPIGVLEVKCRPIDHARLVIEGILPPEHKLQVHFQMAITGLDQAFFYAYSPDMKPLLVNVAADRFTEKVKESLIKFNDDYLEFRSINLPKLR